MSCLRAVPDRDFTGIRSLMSYSLAESFLSGLVQDIAEQQEVKVLFSFIIIQAITPYVYKCQNNDQNMELIGKFTC